ncbi:MAG: dihydroneopterin aldolase [Prochlorothrix sp.]|nr:dihydroneopterin aldolase [Prochlorothrix sp.]
MTAPHPDPAPTSTPAHLPEQQIDPSLQQPLQHSPAPPLDRLWIQDIRAYGYTGYFDEEQRLGQWFAVDLVLSLDLRAAGQGDRLEATLDYGQVVQQVQGWVQTTTVKTIEALAEILCQRLFQTYGPDSGLQHLRLSLTKCHPPIPNFSGQVTVILDRSRS